MAYFSGVEKGMRWNICHTHKHWPPSSYHPVVRWFWVRATRKYYPQSHQATGWWRWCWAVFVYSCYDIFIGHPSPPKYIFNRALTFAYFLFERVNFCWIGYDWHFIFSFIQISARRKWGVMSVNVRFQTCLSFSFSQNLNELNVKC